MTANVLPADLLPWFPAIRRSDHRPVDSVERSPEAVAAMPRWRRRITHPALLWLVAMALFNVGQIVLLVAFLALGENPENEARLGWTNFIANMIGYAVIVGLEGRRPVELLRRPMTFLAAGLAIGVTLITVTAGVVTLLGGIEWGPAASSVDWAPMVLTLGVNAAIGEELLFHGVLFRYVEQGLGTIPALLVSAGFFGAVHLGNPNAAPGSAVAIAVQAGLLLGTLYALTRSLWLVIGVHFAWNVVQSVLFGFNVSGVGGHHGWLTPTPVGNPAISGGAFGLEGSVVAVAVGLLVSVAAVVLVARRGGLVRAAWTRGGGRGAAAPAR
ncbi:CPBP family intramembrane glutamic endopeptidase [Luteococcus sp. OSA5]|uniref:CPBP family intramembrane glutamic endopeptidase n=1 Tax=Luteococcus sp. OSA5 TaxID=3401630 RepID=UPI003B43257C